MRRILLTIGIGVITFTFGVSATVVYWIHQLPDPISLQEPDMTGPVPLSCFPGFSIAIEKKSSASTYFPPSVGETWYRIWDEWYSKVLAKMEEKPLASLTDEDESYRFLWLRSFDDSIAVHVSRKGSKQTIVVTELRRVDRNDPRESSRRDDYSLSSAEWNEFMWRLELASYWRMTAAQGPLAEDGAQWVLEGYRDGHYYVVDRQSPAPGAYRDACLYLLEKAGVLARTPPERVY